MDYGSLWLSTIFGKNGTSKEKTSWGIIWKLFMLITMVRFPALALSFTYQDTMYPSLFWHWIHGVCKCLSYMYDTRYLGLGMTYRAGICTIVISMNGTFKWCQFCCRLNFDPKSWKTMDYGSLWLSTIFGKNGTSNKKTLWGIIGKAVFMLITMAQFPTSYLIHVPRYDVSFTTLDTWSMQMFELCIMLGILG